MKCPRRGPSAWRNSGKGLPVKPSNVAPFFDEAPSPSCTFDASPFGTFFGSRAATLPRSVAMAEPHGPRRRERRQSFADFLGTLSRALDRRHDISLIRGTFEEMVRRVVPARTIQLREAGSRWLSRGDAIAGSESVALEVPGDGVAQGVLEATFDPGSRMGEWDFQMLGAAAHVGALVLEVERLRVQMARHGLFPVVRPPRDGAAPLI